MGLKNCSTVLINLGEAELPQGNNSSNKEGSLLLLNELIFPVKDERDLTVIPTTLFDFSKIRVAYWNISSHKF